LEGRGKKREKAVRKISRQDAGERLLNRARSQLNPQGRMRSASSLFFYEHGRYATDERELVAYYEELGLHTGTDDKHQRPERARVALEKHKAAPARPINRECHFDLDVWLPIVRQFVTEEVLWHPKLGYPYRIEHELLAAGLCLFTFCATKQTKPEWMHTCDQPGQKAWYQSLHEAGVLVKGVKNNDKRNAVMKALQLAGLIVIRDSKAVWGGPVAGQCQKFGLGVNHPSFKKFIAQYGHVVDPKSLPVVNVRSSILQAA
jgi:hypothetical protein